MRALRARVLVLVLLTIGHDDGGDVVKSLPPAVGYKYCCVVTVSFGIVHGLACDLGGVAKLGWASYCYGFKGSRHK